MMHSATPGFWKYARSLPREVKEASKETFARLNAGQILPAMKLKPVTGVPYGRSVRVRHGYRALGIKEGDTTEWVWVGKRGDLDKGIRVLVAKRGGKSAASYGTRIAYALREVVAQGDGLMGVVRRGGRGWFGVGGLCGVF